MSSSEIPQEDNSFIWLVNRRSVDDGEGNAFVDGPFLNTDHDHTLICAALRRHGISADDFGSILQRLFDPKKARKPHKESYGASYNMVSLRRETKQDVAKAIRATATGDGLDLYTVRIPATQGPDGEDLAETTLDFTTESVLLSGGKYFNLGLNANPPKTFLTLAEAIEHARVQLKKGINSEYDIAYEGFEKPTAVLPPVESTGNLSATGPSGQGQAKIAFLVLDGTGVLVGQIQSLGVFLNRVVTITKVRVERDKREDVYDLYV
ncbi:hypothetical protein HBH70_065540 [Parastagonospora nodorum]|nr:hypothetical protein HBH52_229210 [Parastagonospora nodorum]KAH4302898.1 hypothetical protein HBI01_089400 [Parastagonospora nodorum]KAH4311851.1 hypothetical protein HBI02_089810 [Parastagonospora nodorum]KAH4331398.1 hypothetical protein HBI00_075040 [Parastagonospora nodorum]KAH4371535.1 hypothetical protein HBH94_115170 [Parastagonospora nodorum]